MTRDKGQETIDKINDSSLSPRHSSLIKVYGLHKSFPAKPDVLHVLKGINLEISKGEIIAIVGASGVGKSTFLHILGALDSPSSGHVLYDSIDIFRKGDDALAEFRNRSVGFIFQFHHLLPEFTALENTLMPALIRGKGREQAMPKAEHLLMEVGLEGRFFHRPGELSVGEQQRVAVARALMVDPAVVLADEPTGNLDTKTGESVFELLRNINKEKAVTLVLVTHNERLAYDCDRIARMVDGRIDKIDIT